MRTCKLMLRAVQMIEAGLVKFQKEAKTIRAVPIIVCIKNLWKGNHCFSGPMDED